MTAKNLNKGRPPTSIARISAPDRASISVSGFFMISLSGYHRLSWYGLLSKMTLMSGLKSEAQADSVEVVLIKAEHFASRSEGSSRCPRLANM